MGKVQVGGIYAVIEDYKLYGRVEVLSDLDEYGKALCPGFVRVRIIEPKYAHLDWVCEAKCLMPYNKVVKVLYGKVRNR